MKNADRIKKLVRWVPSWMLPRIERALSRVSVFRREFEKEYAQVTSELSASIERYYDIVPPVTRLPAKGHDRGEVLAALDQMRRAEEDRWRSGHVSGAVYHGDREHVHFLNDVYALHSQANSLHADVWPSVVRMEAEVVSMVGRMLGADEARAWDPAADICGTVSSGGTESILLAMKAYRDWGRARGIRKPNAIVPVTAHAAFDKAGEYFGITIIRIPVRSDYRADVREARKALNRNTVALVGSAPSFPHGVIDPIAELSELAREKGAGFHTDACLGGFLLPWAERLGYPVPLFDFRLLGVTSISVDTHKYGYAAKGSSVVLYRWPQLRRYQYYVATEWPGGLYATPTFAGSRPGALVATCWAAMMAMGEEGYTEAARKILGVASLIRSGIESMPELRILGDPLWVIAFGSDRLNIYEVMDQMAKKGWSLNGLHKPAAVHICATLRHAQPGVAQQFLDDLRESVAFVKAHPSENGRLAPLYGTAGTFPLRGVIRELLRRYIDSLYRVEDK